MHCFSNLFDKVLYMCLTGQLTIISCISALYLHTQYRGADKSLARIDNSYVKTKH